MSFGVGATVGGVISGCLAFVASGVVAWVPTWLGGLLVAGFALAAILRDLAMVSFWLPQPKRQVRRDVFRFGPLRGAFRFGVEMGSGVMTFIPATFPYVLLTALWMLAEMPAAFIAVGAAFGLSRGLLPALRLIARSRSDWDANLALATKSHAVLGTGFGAVSILAVVVVQG